MVRPIEASCKHCDAYDAVAVPAVSIYRIWIKNWGQFLNLPFSAAGKVPDPTAYTFKNCLGWQAKVGGSNLGQGKKLAVPLSEYGPILHQWHPVAGGVKHLWLEVQWYALF